MSSRDLGLVFVAGAGLGGWIWERMAPELDHPHLFAEYPGRDSGTEGLRLDDYAAHVQDQVDDLDAERLAVVAHSLGGAVALKVAAGLGNRLAGFAGVAAAIPTGGGSFVSSLPLPRRVLLTVVMRLAGTRPPESALRKGLCSGLEERDADEVVRRFVPESRAVYVEPAGESVPDVPRTYVRLSEDREFGAPIQRRMERNLGATEVREIASGHLPMLSRPSELAHVLNGFARGLRDPAS